MTIPAHETHGIINKSGSLREIDWEKSTPNNIIFKEVKKKEPVKYNK